MAAPKKKNTTARPRSNQYRRSSRPRTGGPAGFGGRLASWIRAGWRVSRAVLVVAVVLGVVGLFSAGLAVGYHQLVSSPFFQVRKVVLLGLDRVDQAEVLTRTGLDRPVGLLELKLGVMAEDLRQHPWIRDVTLTRRLPDTVVIRVEERRPKALIRLGALYYMDEEHAPFKRVDSDEEARLPIISGFTRHDFVSRSRSVEENLDQVFELLNVLAGRRDRFRAENVAQVDFDVVRGLTVRTRTPVVEVKVGFGDFKHKFERLSRVTAYLKNQGDAGGYTYVNLECGPRVVIRPGASAAGRTGRG